MNSWPKLQETLESTAMPMQYEKKQKKTKKTPANLHGLKSLNHALQAIFFHIALAAVLQLVQNF